MKILGIIPARGGSKGIPKKNVKLLDGKPLIAYTIQAALSSKLDKIIVSTDSQEIAELSESYGVEVIIRSAHLSEDTTPTLPVLQDVINKLEESYDAVMTLQPTSPLRTYHHINEAIDIFNNDNNADSLVSVVEVPHNFAPQKLMTYNGLYIQGENKIVRRQEIERIFARNGAAIYITRINRIADYIFGGNVLPYFMSKIDSFDIDDMEDWIIVEKILQGKTI